MTGVDHHYTPAHPDCQGKWPHLTPTIDTRMFMQKDHSSISFDTTKVLLLSFCHFVHDIYSAFLAPLLPFIIEKFGLTLAQAGFLTTAMQIPALINPYIGKLADRMSVRYFIIFAPMATAIPMSLLGVAPNYGVLMLLMFFAGISASLFHVPAPVMIYKLSGGKTGRGMSFYMTGGELARTAGPVAIIGVVSMLGFDGYYPVMIVGIFISLVMFFKFKDMPVAMKPKETISIRETVKSLKHILLPLSGILIVRGFMHACLTAFLPLFILQSSGNVWLSGIALALFEGAGVAGILAVGSLSDKFGRRRLLLVCLVAAPVSLLLFCFVQGALQYVFLLITGFFLLSTTPVMLAMVQEHSEDGSSAANGIFMMMSFLARSAVVVIVGAVADVFGLADTYVACGVFGLLGIPLILSIPADKVKK